MKKMKIIGGAFSSTQKPKSEYVIRLDRFGGDLLVRYFKAHPREQYSNETIATELPAFDPASTPLMRLTVTERNFIEPAAVTSDKSMESMVLSEIGRHIFRPTIGNTTICGAGERNDFAAFVLPFGSDGAVSEVYNHFTESGGVKGVVPRNGRLRGAQPIFILYSDVANAPLDDWTMIYIDSSPFVLEDGTAGLWQPAPNGFNLYSLLPTLTVEAPAIVDANGVATMSVKLSRNEKTLNYSGELALEAVSGYLPKRRVTVENGVGTFKAMALGLDAGDQVRVKIGTRNITGLAEAQITVA